MRNILLITTLISSTAMAESQSDALRTICPSIQGQSEYFDAKCAKLAEKDAKKAEKLAHMSEKERLRYEAFLEKTKARIEKLDAKMAEISQKLAK